MTPAITVAQRAGINFLVQEYSHDAAAESYGLEAAEKLGADPGRVFKTLIASVDDAMVMAVVPVERSLDLKALASVSGGKRATMADPRLAERATGYVTGGISPLGQRRRMRAVVDASASHWDQILVSAGRRGMELELSPGDLVRLLDAVVAAIAR